MKSYPSINAQHCLRDACQTLTVGTLPLVVTTFHKISNKHLPRYIAEFTGKH